jgi:MFS family permease
LVFFTSSLLRFLVPSILPTLSHVFRLNGRDGGLLAAAYWAGYGIFQIPSGLLTDRHGPRRILLGGTVLTAAVGFVTTQAINYSQLLLMQFLLGSASAFIWAPAILLLLNWFEPNERATASGFFNMAFSTGALSPFLPQHFLQNT